MPPTTQPATAPNCEAPNLDSDDPTESCDNEAEFLVEFAGFSCADCLALAVQVALGTASDLPADDTETVPDVRIRPYEPGAPLFSSAA